MCRLATAYAGAFLSSSPIALVKSWGRLHLQILGGMYSIYRLSSLCGRVSSVVDLLK